jgi:hypothetical protein
VTEYGQRFLWAMNYDHLVCLGAAYDTLGWSHESTVQRLSMSGWSFMLYDFFASTEEESCGCTGASINCRYALPY